MAVYPPAPCRPPGCEEYERSSAPHFPQLRTYSIHNMCIHDMCMHTQRHECMYICVYMGIQNVFLELFETSQKPRVPINI